MILNEIVKYNDEWFKIAYKFLNNKEDAADAVQDLYLKLLLKNKSNSLNDISYKNTINKYFIYKTLKHSCIDKLRKKNKLIYTCSFNLSDEEEDISESHKELIFQNIDEIVNTWDKDLADIFSLYMYSKATMKDIAKIYNTSKSTIFNRIKAGKEIIKAELGEDMEDYFNNDFDHF